MDASATQARAFRLDTDSGLRDLDDLAESCVGCLVSVFVSAGQPEPEPGLSRWVLCALHYDRERDVLRMTFDIPPRGAQVLRYFLFAPRLVAVAEMSREVVVTVDDASRLRTVIRLNRTTAARPRVRHDRPSANGSRMVHVDFRNRSGAPPPSQPRAPTRRRI
jgi:hypothetical protein